MNTRRLAGVMLANTRPSPVWETLLYPSVPSAKLSHLSAFAYAVPATRAALPCTSLSSKAQTYSAFSLIQGSSFFSRPSPPPGLSPPLTEATCCSRLVFSPYAYMVSRHMHTWLAPGGRGGSGSLGVGLSSLLCKTEMTSANSVSRIKSTPARVMLAAMPGTE